MDEKQFQELVEKVGKEAAEKIKAAMEEAKKGLVTPEQLDEKLKGLKVDGKGIMIGEKSLEDILRDQGEAITKAQLSLSEPTKVKSIKEILAEKKGDIEKLFAAKQGHITLDIKAAVNMTTANTVDYDTNTIPVEAMESFSLGSYAAKRYGNQFISALADRTTVSSMEKYTIWDEEGDVEGAFAEVSESGLKPLMSADIVKNYAEAQKVAGKYVFSEEVHKFTPRIETIISRIIRDKMVRDYEAILRTDLTAVAASYTGTTLDGTVANPNDYDAIGAVCAQLESLNFIPNVIVLNPQDKWRMRLAKSTEGMYLFPMVTENGTTKVFELNLVTSTYQTAGTAKIAEAGLFKVEEEAMQVRMGYGITMNGGTAEDDFDYNRFRVIVETFVKNYLPTPYVGSVVDFNFNTVKAALLASQE